VKSPSQQFFQCLGIAVVNKHQHKHGVYFSAPIHPGTWCESHIDDWMKARKAKGDLSWNALFPKGMTGRIARVSRRD